MSSNRTVGYTYGDGPTRGTKLAIGNPWTAGTVFTRVEVTAKLVFGPATYTDTSPIITAVWSSSIHVVASGSEPPFPSADDGDVSIMAYDSSDPDGLDRAVWAPDTDTAAVSGSLTRTIRWKGQYHAPETVQWYYVYEDWSSAAAEATLGIAWQQWYTA